MGETDLAGLRTTPPSFDTQGQGRYYTMTTSKDIYEFLLDTPGDVQTMRVLADALDEEGQEDLATAFRYAADRGLWPFQRLVVDSVSVGTYQISSDMIKVYDWDLDTRATAEERSRLPRRLWSCIRQMEDKKYGSVWDAFVLLARALREQGTTITPRE